MLIVLICININFSIFSASLKQELESSKSDNEKLKIQYESIVFEHACLKEQLNNLELQNSILTMEKYEVEHEKNLLIHTKAELDQAKESLIQNQNKAKETEKELLESLKQKSYELNKTKIAEGHLHIKINSLQSELSGCKENFKKYLIKFQKQFEDLHNEYLTCRKDRDRFSTIKTLFQQVLKKDEKFCRADLNSELSSHDELFEMLEAFIMEAFDDKKSHFEETTKSYRLICNLNEANRKNELVMRNLKTQNLHLRGSENNLKTELKMCKENAKIEIDKRDDISKTLREELEELDKICSNLMLKVDKMTEKEQKISELQKQLDLNEEKMQDIEDLKCELKEMEDLAEELRMKNDKLIQKETKAIEEILNLKGKIAQKSEGHEKVNVKLQEKYNLLIQMQKECIESTEKQKCQIKEKDDLIEKLEKEIILHKMLPPNASQECQGNNTEPNLITLKSDFEAKSQQELKQRDDVFIETLKKHSSILCKTNQEVSKLTLNMSRLVAFRVTFGLRHLSFFANIVIFKRYMLHCVYTHYYP